MRPVVAFTANNRPHYLRETLDSWSQVSGVGDAHLIFHAEPGNTEVLAICHAVRFAGRLTVVQNPHRYGALGNPWHAMESGFATGAPFVILAEDDSPVAADILGYFTWAAGHFADRSDVLGVCAFQRNRLPGGPHAVTTMDRFYPTVWGTWAGRWAQVLRDGWDFDYRHKGWDWRINEHHIATQGYRFAGPCESRSQVSGKFGGTHMTPDLFAGHLSDCFRPDYPAGEFQEVPCASW